jgi:lysosomal acid lipase/cholesteryl ester hydrolase
MKSLVATFTVILLLAGSNAADLFRRAPSGVGQVYPSCKNTEFTSLFSQFPDQYVIDPHYINADDGYG